MTPLLRPPAFPDPLWIHVMLASRVRRVEFKVTVAVSALTTTIVIPVDLNLTSSTSSGLDTLKPMDYDDDTEFRRSRPTKLSF